MQPRRAVLSSRNRASFKRDGLGRVVEREERVLSGDAFTSRYEYDVRGRLVSVTTNGVVSESYAYDANGNRVGGEYDAQDRQLAFGGATYAYDLNGSMTNRNGVALTWNLFGRLMSVGGVSYWRDEQQRLCYKEVNGEPVKDWYWSGSRIVAEYDYASDETSFFVYAGATAPAYMIRGGVTYRIITDNQGSVRLVVDAETGEVMQRLDYDSFGRVLRDTNPGFQPFGFQGGLYDPDTGLVEFGCRWYDAETGRWISKDPILLDGGWNVYAFCDNDPVNRTDPTGLWAWIDDAIFAGGGAICGLAGKLVTDVASYCMGNGWNSTIGDYVGVAVGGAVVGETLLYTANPILAGAAGGCAGNITGQLVDVATGEKSTVELMPLFLDTGFGAFTGILHGPKISGITAGRGSCLQISKQMRTKCMDKLKNGTTPIIKDKMAFTPTAIKMFKGEYYDKAMLPGSIAASSLSKTASVVRGSK